MYVCFYGLLLDRFDILRLAQRVRESHLTQHFLACQAEAGR